MTFFYTNAQSARLQFYHDHAHGITRLNVYAGEAAGYVVTDAVEQDMIAGTNVTGVNPGLLKVLPGLGIPLVIQDKTFVDAETVYAQDPTWAWGSGAPGTAVTGDFWYPHVYMTVTNPWDADRNERLRPLVLWALVQPPHPDVRQWGPGGMHRGRPRAEPLPSGDCDLVPPGPGCTAPWEPPLNPGVPNPSIPGESFLDTMIVNGTAYPALKVEPKAYRFRILNAGNDRALNLQLYVAADKTARHHGNRVDPGASVHRHRRGGELHRGQDGPGQCRPGKPVRRHAERHSRSGNGRTVVDPDRHRGWLHAGAGRDPAAADRVQPRPGLLQFRHRQPALAVPHASGARGCHR